MVWRPHAEPVEHSPGLERIVGGFCVSGFGWLRWVCHRDRDAWLDLVALDTLRCDGAATYVWLCSTDWGDGAELDDG